MSNNTFNVVNFPADTGGCGHYRIMFPIWSVRTIRRDVRFVESFKLITDQSFFRDFRMIRVQRQVNDAQADYLLNFILPISKAQGQWVSYDIDDCINYADIPSFNASRSAFNSQKFFDNVKKMLAAVDILTVTTDTLGKYYVDTYGVDPKKVVVIPNFLPRWWIGETYNPSRQDELWKQNRHKPRIGFPVSSSHFDLKNINGGVDDFTHITDFVRSTVKDYQWVFVGHIPKQLEDLAIDKKVEVVPGSDLLNYPRELWRRNLQCVVAPLQDNTFNRCKSNIKLLESWALGMPCIAQDLECYNKYTDTVFKDANQLANQLDRILHYRDKYLKHIKENRQIIDYGNDVLPNGAWIEKQLWRWINLFTLPQKTLTYDLPYLKGQIEEKIRMRDNPKVSVAQPLKLETGVSLDL